MRENAFEIRIRQHRALALIELALIVIIASLVFGTVTPAVMHHMDAVKAEESEEDIEDLIVQIDDFYSANGHFPDSLEEVFGTVPLDPWGNPYQYLRIDGGNVKGKGKLRKDKNLVPINSDYDFYSMGPDGKTASPLTSKNSHDDIVRGRNGAFIGVATEF